MATDRDARRAWGAFRAATHKKPIGDTPSLTYPVHLHEPHQPSRVPASQIITKSAGSSAVFRHQAPFALLLRSRRPFFPLIRSRPSSPRVQGFRDIGMVQHRGRPRRKKRRASHTAAVAPLASPAGALEEEGLGDGNAVIQKRVRTAQPPELPPPLQVDGS